VPGYRETPGGDIGSILLKRGDPFILKALAMPSKTKSPGSHSAASGFKK
jgi:hypothetical protein